MKSSLPLPQELVNLILESAPKNDLKTLRLVCKKLKVSATPYLFNRIYISSYPLDLEVFDHILENSTLAKGVIELIWDDTTFAPSVCELEEPPPSVWGPPKPDDLTGDFESEWDEWLYEKFAGFNDSDKEAKLACRVLQCLQPWGPIARRRNIIRSEGLDEKALSKALSRGHLPNIRNVTWAFWPHKKCMTPEEWTGARLMSPTRALWYRVFEANGLHDWSPNGDGTDEADLESVSGRGFGVLFRCFAAANRPLHTLFVRSSATTHALHYREQVHLFVERGGHLKFLVELLMSLRVLRLTFDFLKGQKVPQLVRVLQAATELEELRLVWEWDTKTADALTPVLKHLNLHKLRVFQVIGFNIEKVDFLDFLERHKPTLRDLVILKCPMHEPGDQWHSILLHLKNSDFQIEHCVIDSVSDWETEEEASHTWTYGQGECSDKKKARMTRDFLYADGAYPLRIDESARPYRLLKYRGWYYGEVINRR